VLTVLGGGGGWLLGTVVAPRIKAATAAVQATTKAAGDSKEALRPHRQTVSLRSTRSPPISPIPLESWIRLELALLFKGPPDAQLAQAIHQDILAYIRTVSLQQIEGARGLPISSG
jgi:flagellar FliL protein